jgi:hypothetical protein
MIEFDGLREQLARQRQELEQHRQQALLAREAVRQAERRLQNFERRAGEQQLEERNRLEAELRGAQAESERLAGILAELGESESQVWKRFRPFTDPRQGVQAWSVQSPILLFPLRLETRFKLGAEGQPQLWLRIFPDACLVDTFEEALTEQEIENARLFWASIWRANGEEALERAAWRDLVAAHGSGRAGWIVRRYTPLNPSDKPVKDRPEDVLLIIPTTRPLSDPVLPELQSFWKAYWRAERPDGSIDMDARRAAETTLQEAVGAPQAAELIANFRPFNLEDAPVPPRPRDEVQVEVALLLLTPPSELPTRRTSWSSAPRVHLLPERFIFIGFWSGGEPLVAMGNPIHTPLVAGPDPNAPPEKQLKQDGERLQIPDEIAWMFNFERALQEGMALRIDLNAQQAESGFERVLVLGLRLTDSPSEGQQNLLSLLNHHLYSRSGLELLPQGTPTNNTEQAGAGYSFRDNPDASFLPFFRQEPQYTPQPDPLLRRDGQWLAQLLGLGPDLVQRIPHAGETDQLEARAMQIALWPGTLGYMLRTLLAPIFSEPDVADTRFFFTRYVSGRGPLPALRIGDQPYGILPATAFERIKWFHQDRKSNFLSRLYTILRRIQDDWKPLVRQVSFIGKNGGDPHQILLDVLGLHPSSVEYYPLQAESVEHRFYELAFLDYSISLQLLGLFPAVTPLTLLRSLGYTGDQVPDLLNKIYRARQTPLTGPLVDDRPLSENEGIRKYAGDLNYIQWLAQAARTDVQSIQQETGFDNDQKPAALLYLLLRHAVQIGFLNTGVRLQAEAGIITDVNAMLREPAFVHVQQLQGSESRYDVLFRPAEVITRSADLRLGDYIADNIRSIDTDLAEHIDALERLSLVSTARLERLFAEHIDTASYRLDAWKMGLLTWQLEQLHPQEQAPAPGLTAGAAGETEEAEGADDSQGLFLGAYGWLEPLRPEARVLTDPELDEEIASKINREGDPPLKRDSANQGLIHAPSLNHALTAAVLRNGYIGNDGRLAVNLTSRRVRLALGILEGMRGGQSLGALLGYQFERYVHDHGPLQVRALIYPLRREFALAANQIEKTKTEEGQAKQFVTAMNVVDGRKLIEHVEKEDIFTYPFGRTTLPPANPAQQSALDAALAHIRDINDAIADLVLAEGVHQAVLGNYERSSGTLDAFAKGNYPPEPDVIRTPRSGITLTLRTAIHMPLGPHPAPLTPLAKAEPALNAWLRDRLPTPSKTGCRVKFTDRATGASRTEFISQADLGLDAIDLIYRIDTPESQALSDLDDRILHFLYTHAAMVPRLDRPIEILYTQPAAGGLNWFELQALLRSLRAMTVASRPLQPADLVRHNDAQREELPPLSLDVSRIETARDDLRDTRIPELDSLLADLADATINIDAKLEQFSETLGALAAYRLPQTGTGFVYEQRLSIYVTLVDKIDKRVERWNTRLDEYLDKTQKYDERIVLDPSVPESERIALLQAAEILISRQLTQPAPVSGTYRSDLDDRRDDFIAKRNALQDLIDTARTSLAQVLADANAELPLTDFDPEPLDFADTEAEIERLRLSMVEAVGRLKSDLEKRITRVNDLLHQHGSAASSDAVNLLQEAGKILFGEDFILIPQFTLSADAATELANAWNHSRSGALTSYLTGDPTADPPGLGRDFPVDDWLHGVARVREQMRHWENALFLGEGLPGAQPPELTPLQFPYSAKDSWLALEFPATYRLDSDRLLYTADFPSGFNPAQPMSGLVVDEWTEVIPGPEETTGIAFHFDRPNTEPPQAWLLALPTTLTGTWSWDDLLGAVLDTLDSAKIRALEPVHIDSSPYSAFLPATVAAYTFPEISISNNLLRNVEIYARLAKS